MNIKKHFLMTFSALFFLGIIVTKPGSSFHDSGEKRVCKFAKGKMDCDKRTSENLPQNFVEYKYE